MSSQLIIGLTGGIGSGKTAVSDYFSDQLGIVIVDADQASRACVEPGSPALERIAEHFGQPVIQPDMRLNRAALRQIIFNDPKAKHWLEQLLHPQIGEYLQDRLKKAQSPYAIMVSPLLLETQQKQWVDRILVVDASEQLQLERAALRDHNNQGQIEKIMAAQMPRTERLKQADDKLINEGSLDSLYQQIEALHQKYLKLTQAK